MNDFTLKIYTELLRKVISHSNDFITLEKYFTINTSNGKNEYIILRHDVDRLPENALKSAVIEKSLGIKGTYFFRIVSQSFNLEIMEKITKLDHEIGYHYEDVDLVYKKIKEKR
jgi:hypothetical protein